jgi:hypothetical protein
MEPLVIEIHEDAYSVIQRLVSSTSNEVELEIPEGSVLFENSLNLKLIQKEAQRIGKTIEFSTNDPAGLVLLDMLQGGQTEAKGVSDDFVSREVTLDEVMGSPKKSRSRPSLPKVRLRLPKIRFPSISFKPKLGVVLFGLILLGGLGFFGYKLFWKDFSAEAEIVVASQPLIKSVQVSVGVDYENNVKDKQLAGNVVTSSVTESQTVDTTGTKIVGEKASGKVEIENWTTSEKAFDDGEELYSKDDDDLKYVLDDDVTVAAGTVDPSTAVMTPGKSEVDVTAEEIGKDHNIDSGETLEFDDHSSSKYRAKAKEDIDGGSSDILSVVTQTDLDNLHQALLEDIVSNNNSSVKENLENGWVLVEGSQVSGLTTEEFDKKVNDEADEVKVTQTVLFSGLSYRKKSLDSLLQDILGDFVPDGFELSDETPEINVEILGNTDATTLTSQLADLQVTMKSYVLPEIDEDSIKEELVGKSVGEAEKILGGVRNMKTYSLNISPNIPFFSKLPSNIENISVTVERD